MEVKGLIHSLSIFLFPFLGDGVAGDQGLRSFLGNFYFKMSELFVYIIKF